MDEVVRTNPTATVTARDFAKVVKPVRLEGLSPEDWNAALKLAEERGMALAARLSIEHKDGRLPSYIWAIAFGQD